MPKSITVGSIEWKRFGARIGREVAKTGLSYRDLAECLSGITYANLNRVVHGTHPVSATTYLWLCNEFSIDPMWAYHKPKPD